MAIRNIQRQCGVNDSVTQPPKYTCQQFNIQGSRVMVSFPEKCVNEGVMDVVKQILVYAHVNNELGNNEVDSS